MILHMPNKRTIDRARRDAREGKAPTTQAGEFVREEIEHIREGKHGAKSTKQAIAIGLSKARRAGVKLGPQPESKPARTQRRPASKKNLARQAKQAASRRSPTARSRSAKKAARTRARSR